MTVENSNIRKKRSTADSYTQNQANTMGREYVMWNATDWKKVIFTDEKGLVSMGPKNLSITNTTYVPKKSCFSLNRVVVVVLWYGRLF